MCACAYNLGHALVCSIYCMNKAVGYTKLNNIMGFVHLVTIKKTSKFQRKPRGSQHVSFFAQDFLAVSGKRKSCCRRPKQLTVSGTSGSLFIFLDKYHPFWQRIIDQERKKTTQFFLEGKLCLIRLHPWLTHALTSHPVKADG